MVLKVQLQAVLAAQQQLQSFAKTLNEWPVSGLLTRV